MCDRRRERIATWLAALRWALAALAASAVCRPAMADWQGTVWNSTVQQADQTFRLPHREPTPDEFENWAGEIGIAFDYRLNGLTFYRGALLFMAGRLYAISMDLRDPGECETLITMLRRIYGVPTSERQPDPTAANGTSHLLIWHDRQNHNAVMVDYETYSFTKPDCILQYRPFFIRPPGRL